MLRIMVCLYSMGYQHIAVTNQNSHVISDSSQHLPFQGKPHIQIEELQNSTLCYRMRHGSTQKLEINSKFLEPQVNLIIYRVQIIMVTPTYPRASLKNICRKHIETLLKKSSSAICVYVCVSVCLCMYYIYVCMYECAYVYMYMYYVCMHVFMNVCIYMYVCAYMHVCGCIYMFGCMYVCM